MTLAEIPDRESLVQDPMNLATDHGRAIWITQDGHAARVVNARLERWPPRAGARV